MNSSLQITSTNNVADNTEEIGEHAKHGHAKYIIAMAVEIALLYIFNNLLHNYITSLAPYVVNTYPHFIVNIVDTIASWRVPYFTDSFTNCLLAINITLAFAITANLALLLYHPKWLHHLIKGVIFGLACFPTYVVLNTFPFVFTSSQQTSAARIVLIIFLVGLAINFVLEMALLALALLHRASLRIQPD